MICHQLWTSRSPFQSRCRDMLTVNVKKSRKETMHISWKNAWHCRFQHWHLKFMLFSTLKRGGGGHRIDWRGYGTDAPGLFVLTHQGQVNIWRWIALDFCLTLSFSTLASEIYLFSKGKLNRWRWIALDFCLKCALSFYVCAHRLMRTYASTYAYVRLNTSRIRQGASEAPQRRPS